MSESLCHCYEFHTEKDDADETTVEEMDCRCHCHIEMREATQAKREIASLRAEVAALRANQCEDQCSIVADMEHEVAALRAVEDVAWDVVEIWNAAFEDGVVRCGNCDPDVGYICETCCVGAKVSALRRALIALEKK